MLGFDGTYTLRFFADVINKKISPKIGNISDIALCVLTILFKIFF